MMRAQVSPPCLPRSRSVARLATACAVALGACRSPQSGHSDTTLLARALGGLRRSVVGDRRFGGSAAGATSARAGSALRYRGPGGLPPHAQHGAESTTAAHRTNADSALATQDTAWGDPSEWPTRVIPFTTTDASPVTAWVGDTLTLPAPLAPEGTPPSMVRDLRWTSTESGVATVSASGAVVAHAPGTAQIIAWRRVGQTVTPVTVRPAIRGRVVAADSVPLRARVIVRAGSWTDTAWTGPGGWFVLRAERELDGTATLRIEPNEETYSAALLTDAPVERLTDVDVVLLPARWRITGGTYDGTVVTIRPSVASGRLRDALHLWHLARPGRGRAPDTGQPVGWAPERLPLPLALDHAARGGPIGASDSVAFWRAARQLERDWGTSLFVPATLPAGDSGFGGIVVTVDPRIGSEGLTTTGWNGDGDLYDAVVAVRARALLGEPGIVTHELLHALGIGHAPYTVSSVMHPVADAGSPRRASSDDVAYAQLLYAVRAHSRPGRTLVGITEAAAAESRR